MLLFVVPEGTGRSSSSSLSLRIKAESKSVLYSMHYVVKYLKMIE